ncbi:MAG TPA: hypothetical protein VK280_19350 [Streptosporangiaceae bacterium]|nr:hypothetical protein [Streptosporangiaceae bacterium]
MALGSERTWTPLRRGRVGCGSECRWRLTVKIANYCHHSQWMPVLARRGS